jgi:hypothetical protein
MYNLYVWNRTLIFNLDIINFSQRYFTKTLILSKKFKLLEKKINFKITMLHSYNVIGVSYYIHIVLYIFILSILRVLAFT